MQFYLVLALVFALGVAVFAVQNAGPVQVRFFGWHFETSLVAVILGSALAGACIVALVGLFKQVQMVWQLRGARSRISQLEGDVQKWKAAAATAVALHAGAQPAGPGPEIPPPWNAVKPPASTTAEGEAGDNGPEDPRGSKRGGSL